MADAEIEEWNAAVASGDTQRIASARSAVLREINAQIMDDDPNYRVAGYRVQSNG